MSMPLSAPGTDEGIPQTGGVGIGGAVDNAHLGVALIRGVLGSQLALEGIPEAGTEHVVHLGGQGVRRAGGSDEDHTLGVCNGGDGGGAAGGGGAHHQLDALGDQRVHGVDALGGVALVILAFHRQLVGAVAEGDAAGGVDLLHRQVHAVGDVGAVDGHAAVRGPIMPRVMTLPSPPEEAPLPALL